MNNKKIAIIICVNDDMYFEECKFYIDRLLVPENFELELLTIRDAESMCAAYNLGMGSTDAKYKIYMHQDVFIREENFLKEVLERFQTHPEVGMIGMVGGTDIPSSGVVFDAWNAGMVDVREPDMAYYMHTKEIKEDLIVRAIDGLIMVTQYDVFWREDLFPDFDFYDISQSCEFRRNGYQIMIPCQNRPWVIHNPGFAKLKKYDSNRKIFLEEYSEFVSLEKENDLVYDEEWEKLSEQLACQIKQMMTNGEWEMAERALEIYHQRNWKSSALETLSVMSEIRKMEFINSSNEHFFSGLNDYQQMYEKYMQVRFLLIRIELGVSSEECRQLEEMILKEQISYEAIYVIMLHSIVNKKAILDKLLKLYQKNGREDCCGKIRKLMEIVEKNGLPITYSKAVAAL